MWYGTTSYPWITVPFKPTIGLGVGVLYGTTSVAVGHPFDTVKTKMQAQTGFETRNMLRTFGETVRAQGVRGLYRGCLPPLMGSGIFRSTQFAGTSAHKYVVCGEKTRGKLSHDVALVNQLV